jgi:hypothetical protein
LDLFCGFVYLLVDNIIKFKQKRRKGKVCCN